MYSILTTNKSFRVFCVIFEQSEFMVPVVEINKIAFLYN